MKKIDIVSAILLMIFALGCKKDDDFGEQSQQKSDYAVTKGVYILNEGNFNSGNSSISFLQLDPLKIENNIFYTQNTRPLGDVAQHIVLHNELAYVVVNNSGKIEVVDLDDFSSVATIDGLNSPRYLQVINDSKALVTDLYSDSLTIIDLKSYSIKGYINVGCATNSILMVGRKVFAANWTGNKIAVIDTAGGNLEHITVAKEPNSMVVDANGMVWVLSTGGYMHEEKAAITLIDPQNLNVIKKIEFADNQAYPSRLVANNSADSLFFINKNVYCMSIDDATVPESFLINGSEYNFYGMAIDPNNSKIYITDAGNYLQSGYFYRFNTEGEKVDSFAAGVIPGEMAFSQTYYSASQSGN